MSAGGFFGRKRKTMAKDKDRAKDKGEAKPVEPEETQGREPEKTDEATPCDGAKPADEAAKTEGEAAETAPEPREGPDWKDRYARLLADFDNFKKRTARDREDTYRFAEADILKDVLPVVDNLSLALVNAKDREDAFVKGVQLVYDSLLKTLADHGAKPMEELVGKELDPNFHEAIATLPNAEIEEGRISNVAKTGWTLNDRLLRAAQVVVSAGDAGGK